MVLAAYACCSPMAYAQYEPQYNVDVSVGGGISSNPFLYADGKTAGSANIDIAPSVVVEDELGQTRIGGNLRFTQYSKYYGNDVSARLEAATDRKLDERNSVRVAASVQRLRSAVQDGLIFGSGGTQTPGPLLPPTLPIIDTTLAGTRSRITSLNTSFGLSHILDEISSVDAGIELNGTYIEDDVGFDYRSAYAHAGYRRKLSQRTTVTFDTQIGFVDYLGRRTGDSLIVSPRIGVQQQLTDRLSLVADAGISYVRTDVAGGDKSNLTSFAGSIGLCDRGPNRSLCLSGGRSAQPTALGGVSTVTTASLNYDARLSRVDRVSLAARYGRTNQDGAGLPIVRVTDFIGASATYSRDLNDRLALTVTPSYSKVFDDAQPRGANYALMVGLTIRLGKRR
ncbi:MAG: hypothetical protein EOP63_01990 [Sphingomonadales bacterium]|nr:MAG: hypothetical protein EOP63_01990 [Sphingomonadales bacterium]